MAFHRGPGGGDWGAPEQPVCCRTKESSVELRVRQKHGTSQVMASTKKTVFIWQPVEVQPEVK